MWRRLPMLVPAVALALLPAGARAEIIDNQQGTIQVGPAASGSEVSQGSAGFGSAGTQAGARSDQTRPGAGADVAPAASAASSGITVRPVPGNAVCAPSGPPQVGTGGAVVTPICIPAPACPPGQTGFYTYDATGAPLGLVCVSNQAAPPAGTPAATAVRLAQHASGQQPWPVLQVAVNPGVGMTGLESWFWLRGNASMPDVTATAGSLTVTVRATLAGVTWDFGDGSGVSSGADPGAQFPAPSGVRHVYQSDTFGTTGGATVTALVRYRVTYSVNGGPFALLGLKARPYTADYAVEQLQPQAVSGS